MKTNLLKNMTAAIAALLIALVALPQVAKAEEFWLLGTKYNADTEVEIGGGKATWNKASRTLTLNNVNLESHDGRFIYCEEISSFKIELVGTNKINCTGEGLYFKKGDVKIYGSGSLTINSASNFAIYQTDTTPCTLTIKDCTIDARGEKSSIGGYYNGSNTETLTLALENATLTVKGATGGWGWKESGITAIKSWDLNNCHIATEGVKLGKSGSNTYYCLIKDGDVYIGEAKIIPGMPQAKEAYVVENGSTLTFYYDKQKNSRTGTVYDIDQKKQAGSVPVPVWAGTETNKKESILKAVFLVQGLQADRITLLVRLFHEDEHHRGHREPEHRAGDLNGIYVLWVREPKLIGPLELQHRESQEFGANVLRLQEPHHTEYFWLHHRRGDLHERHVQRLLCPDIS